VSQGLLESCVRDLPERPLALTLFRSTRRTVLTDGEPGGQLQGELRFNYWLVPFCGAADRSQLCDLGVRLAAGLRDVQMTSADMMIHRSKAQVPPKSSFLSLNGAIVISSVREVEGTLEVRLFNPQTKSASARLDFSRRPRGAKNPSRAQRVNFEGHPQGKPVVFAGAFKTTLKPKEIVTLQFTGQ